MKIMRTVFMMAVVLTWGVTPVWAAKYDESRQMFRDAGVGDMFGTAYGYALFPSIGKGGLGFGGAYGKGRVYQEGEYIGDTSMVQASFGLQLGGTAFSQVVFFQDKRALEEFTSGNFEFGVEAQATALTAAAGSSANTGGISAVASGGKNNVVIASAGYNRGLATYHITKGGLMYEASIGGQKFNFTRK